MKKILATLAFLACAGLGLAQEPAATTKADYAVPKTGGAASAGGSGAPTDATYLTKTAESGLSAEFSLGSLTTGLLLNTVSAGTGTPSAYAGTSCTNQFPRSLNASGAATCASVALATDISGFGANVAAALATLSSANLATAVTDETGTGALVFATSPTFAGTLTFADNYKRTFDKKTEFYFEDDFTGVRSSATSTCADMASWQMSVGPGTADGIATAGCTSEANHPGVVTMTTDDNAAGSASMNRMSGAFGNVNVTGMRWVWNVRVPVLSDGTHTFTVRVGLNNTTSASADTDALTCWYTHTLNSGEWECRAVKSGSGTSTVDSNVAVVAGTWYQIEFRATSATAGDFYINGSSVGSISTNMPTVAGLAPIASILKSASTTPRTFDLDYFTFWMPVTR